ncbi:DNA adenine methylase [Natronorubrum daqingense]|uniref:site-specific DNA-methyltransferase (adenine-specific) n=1 Tax=Natronorubrum daqingense TaxID=588898 RepID=A0A1N7G2G6_9EURY|nr:DNA adenine methylase [Natronorubrum daqingense]APX98656.1 hypothetical protein BB347_18370 [Natronorubrum daqingense]SIS06751.1 DNA adenine methylase [Natronorubrum daqingense]
MPSNATARSVFGYPGNKAGLSSWVLEHFPDHRTYVEVFGGAAGILANKPPSYNEVYNDVDGDLVQFFDVLRKRGDELAEWCATVPYSREKYGEWSSKWYDGWRPDDAVRRAGVFYYLRQVSFNGKYYTPGGFAVSTKRNQARTYANQVDRLEMFADRFREVVVEHLDWRACVEQWDDEETLLYFDPPYPDREFRYREGPGFDHGEFVDSLGDLESRWLVSYADPPAALIEVADLVATKETKYRMASGHNGDTEESTEVLAMNFNPREADLFVDTDHHQATLANGGCIPSTTADDGGDE